MNPGINLFSIKSDKIMADYCRDNQSDKICACLNGNKLQQCILPECNNPKYGAYIPKQRELLECPGCNVIVQNYEGKDIVINDMKVTMRCNN
jgi:hypothetical protein